MKLKDILKSKGWTDEQIAAAFADPNALNTLESIFGEVNTELESLKTRDSEWDRKLREEYQPAISKAERDAMEARRKAADLEEQVRIARDYGYLDGDEATRRAAEAAAAANARNDPNSYDPKRHPTFEDVSRFADAEGEAIAMVNDLAAEYSYLTGGKSIFEYETQINGTPMRGMRALRQEAKAARKNLDLYISEKFDFNGKRQQRAAEAQKAHDDAIRKEADQAARLEMAEKYGNPNLAFPTPSRKPFMPSRTPDGKHPWERGSAQERKAERIRNAMQAQVSSGAVQ